MTKKLALAKFLELEKEDIELLDLANYTHYGLTVYRYIDEEYAVGTSNEVEIALEKAIKQYINEYVYSNIPEQYNTYFDEESFIEDLKADSISFLATYNGIENEIVYDNTLFYIYRLN